MYRVGNTSDTEAARRMLVALTAYRRAFDVFVRSGMNTAAYDELAVCTEEIRLAKQDVFRLVAREIMELVLLHSEVMTQLWQQQLSEIRGMPAALALAMSADTLRLRQSHDEAVGRLDAACRAILTRGEVDTHVAVSLSAPMHPRGYALGR